MTELNPPFALQNAGATHTAEGDRLMVSGLMSISNGFGLAPLGGVNMAIGSEFSVTQTATPSMAVLVNSGVCYVPGSESTKQGVYCCVNDAQVTRTVTTAHGTLPRIDSVVAHVYDSQYSGVTNTWAIEVIAGTAATTPVAPTLPANCIRLFNINVGAAVSSIVNANIVDVRTPLVAAGGIFPTTSGAVSSLVANSPDGQAFWLKDTGVLQFNMGGTLVTRSSANTTQTGLNSVSFSNKNSHTYNITFPVAFATIPKVFANINSSAAETGRWIARVYNITTTGATVFLFFASDTTTLFTWSGQPVAWFATL